MNPTGTPAARAPNTWPSTSSRSPGSCPRRGPSRPTASLVVVAPGRIDYRTFLFASVGDDSGHREPSRNDADEAGMGVDDRGGVGGAPDGQAVVLLLDLAVSGDDHAKGATGLGGRREDLHVRACT
jgi:hypothetical protein